MAFPDTAMLFIGGTAHGRRYICNNIRITIPRPLQNIGINFRPPDVPTDVVVDRYNYRSLRIISDGSTDALEFFALESLTDFEALKLALGY